MQLSLPSKIMCIQWVLLIAATLAAYAPVHEAGFLIDDKEFFIEDPVMNDPMGWKRIWLNPTDNSQLWPYLPITRTTFWIERQWWGLNLSVTHWVNVGFHLVGVVLLWGILLWRRIPGAWWISMAFALHPVHVQTVAWISERKNVVSLPFYLLAFACYLIFRERAHWGWFVGALFFFFSALLSKTSTIMLPILLIVVQVWQFPQQKLRWKEVLPFVAIAIIMGTFRIWFEVNAFGATGASYDRSLIERLITAAHVPFFYISKWIVPYPLVFTYPKWNFDFASLTTYLPLLSLSVIALVLSSKYFQWGRPLLLGLAAFGISLFPVSGMINNAWTQFSFVADHWMHLPSLPLFILAGIGLFSIRKLAIQKNMEILWKGMAVGILCVWGILTTLQVPNYQSPERLWRTTLQHHPDAWAAHADLGRLLEKKGEYEQALYHLDRAIQINPDYFMAYLSRGLAYFDLGNLTLALRNYNRAVQLNPRHAENYYNRGLAFSHLEQTTQAIQDYNQTLTLDPKFLSAYLNRAAAFNYLGQHEQALADYNEAIRLVPDYIDAYQFRALTYFYLKQYESAIRDYTQVLEWNPQQVVAYSERGAAYFHLGHFEQALQDYNSALRLQSNHIQTYVNRGILFQTLNQTQQSCEDFKQACRLGHCQLWEEKQRQRAC